ncbi:MAG: hypothetical protein SOZ18_02430 [Phocaeicola sp.]|nr:hypothetical protein [Phocaeicola sp.]
MEKEKYEAPTVEILTVCFPLRLLETFSMEGNVIGYEGTEEGDF